MARATNMAHVPLYIYIYTYMYRTSSNLYTPGSVSLASLARQLLNFEILVLFMAHPSVTDSTIENNMATLAYGMLETNC